MDRGQESLFKGRQEGCSIGRSIGPRATRVSDTTPLVKVSKLSTSPALIRTRASNNAAARPRQAPRSRGLEFLPPLVAYGLGGVGASIIDSLAIA